MKNVLTFTLIIAACGVASAQPDKVDTVIHDAHVKNVFEYELINGQKQLVRRASYDTAGRNTGRCVINRYNARTDVSTDTFIVHDTNNYTCIAKEKNEVYDSVQYSTVISDNRTHLTRLTWHKGKIVLKQEDVYDSLPVTAVATDHSSKHQTATWYIYEFQFDSLNRITEQHQKKYIDDGNTRKLTLDYWSTVSYGEKYIVHKLLSTIAGVTTNTNITYATYDHRTDSCVSFNDDGQIDYTFAVYKNVQGRDSLSIERDRNGVITHRNVTQYSGDTITFVHYDETGAIWKTEERVYNDRGLLLEVTDIVRETGEVNKRLYEYSYY